MLALAVIECSCFRASWASSGATNLEVQRVLVFFFGGEAPRKQCNLQKWAALPAKAECVSIARAMVGDWNCGNLELMVSHWAQLLQRQLGQNWSDWSQGRRDFCFGVFVSVVPVTQLTKLTLCFDRSCGLEIIGSSKVTPMSPQSLFQKGTQSSLARLCHKSFLEHVGFVVICLFTY